MQTAFQLTIPGLQLLNSGAIDLDKPDAWQLHCLNITQQTLKRAKLLVKINVNTAIALTDDQLIEVPAGTQRLELDYLPHAILFAYADIIPALTDSSWLQPILYITLPTQIAPTADTFTVQLYIK